ncbi:tripartite tricarboxylate transporter substrate binding protein [Cupriavidus sp.]|uniref:Bug family tripartite tricarboxylate transporter substrate binding protein n=1 Tax=Cupriavidus sp. TaxID=1873897 RepID=UPI0025BDBF5F|nr:tripartite tricarboxylate transporter substrate binding protein [Cupriavidus sp.]MCA3774304.1 tripartite tricarboxylate transporter substrate binding protein [Cutibacterium sp.]MCA3187686.1 tripartite tricarboxylate transporter substrate binding protein [Cupriavidus sp.]MCA3189124.1 tripartite tricarboxylate transporter substrate binding protein [Cupriavidus sp.]MCA3198844.1 tripartite tricarboxylate transporter substrate binding protein [Cupriavidus sp.]MCA3201588.1 tripartite tricarboxyla
MKTYWMALCVATLGVASAHAQAPYPDHPVRMVVGFAAGGSTDLVARIVANKLSAVLGQAIVVENKAGAGGTIATDAVAKSKADGYTLLFGTSSHAINTTLYKRLPYDPNDVVPVSVVASVPMVLAVTPSVKANNAKELVDDIRRNPAKYSYGSAGKGSALHMAVELLKYQEKIEVIHVPFRGASQAIQSVMAGDVQFLTDAVSTAAPMVQSGKLKALAVTTATRSSVLPNVPTMKEAGFPNYETSIWNMVMVPRGTPTPVIEKLSAALQTVVRDAEVKQRMQKIGVEPVIGSTPEKAAAFVQAETRRWAEVIKAGNIQPE